MSPVSTRIRGHNGASLPPRPGGGGDDGMPDFIPDSVPNYGERLRRARFGLAVAMTPIIVLFVTFTAVFLIRRFSVDIHDAVYVRTWVPVKLPWTLLLLNTAILIASSVTIDFARRRITREAALAPVRSIPGISLGDESNFPWLALTTVLGLMFLAGQILVWTELSAHGFHLAETSSSFIYILTAMHGLHLSGGILALVVSDIAAALHRPVETRRIVVDVASWYWHCMTGIWIYILVLFSFAAS